MGSSGTRRTRSRSPAQLDVRALLGARKLGDLQRSQLELALQHPWCWPSTDADLADRARSLGFAPPPPPAVGQICLVSATRRPERVALWAFGPDTSETIRVPLRGDALLAWSLAQSMATRELPALTRRPTQFDQGTWGARPIAKYGSHRYEALEGGSYGLGMCLAVASYLLRCPVPSGVVASAVIRRDGSLGSVDCLDYKLDIISGSALGIDRVLVAMPQVDEANRHLESLGQQAIRVIGVARLEHAFEEVFSLQRVAEELWPTLPDAWAEAEQLLWLALNPAITVAWTPALIGWSGVAQAATALVDMLDGKVDERSAAARRNARIARRIAERHRGRDALLPWPEPEWLSALGRPARLSLLAHVVQSAADADSAKAAEYIALALPHVAPHPERYPGDLELLGAIGRASAAIGHHREAAAILREALDDWLFIRHEHAMSYALCEYLRVVGLLGAEDSVQQACDLYLPPFERHPFTDFVSRAFVWVAIGRALVLVGRPDRACRSFESVADRDWSLTPAHVNLSRLRWWARALFAGGQPEAAAEVRRQLAQSAENGPAVPDSVILLARLDQALEQSRDTGPILRALQEHPIFGSEVNRLMVMLRRIAPGGGSTARLVADHYRY